MTEREKIEILEGISREGPPTARIQAIRVVRELGVDRAGGSVEALDELGLRRR
jgi:hypothetical protein